MDSAAFFKLRKYDLVVLANVGDVPNGLLLQAPQLSNQDLIICKVIKEADPAEPSPSRLTLEFRNAACPENSPHRFINQADLNPTIKNEFNADENAIFEKAHPNDIIESHPGDELTISDRRAIEDPGAFIEIDCKFRWLPTHGLKSDADPVSVRDRYSSKKEVKRLSYLGLLRLLEYRNWITERILENIVEQTYLYTLRTRVREAERKQLSDNAKTEYLKIKRLTWKAAGSTTPTSDIDISLSGDGTEFAVWAFNNYFRSLHNNVESGIVFDVNAYGASFIPDLTDVKLFPPTNDDEEVKIIRPTFDHEFETYVAVEDDADEQLKHALIKLYRYTPPILFSKLFESRFLGLDYFLDLLRVAKETHLKWQAQIARNYDIVSGAQLDLSEPLGAAARSLSLNHDPAQLMKVQNAFYEHVCRKDVEEARTEFEIAKLVAEDADIDEPYIKLRAAISKSCYFANESYPTAGAIIQTVAGKQLISRNVGPDRFTEKSRNHNIAYTAHELIASIVDQLSDIHKESGRHFSDDGSDWVGSLLACGKYIHRLLNSVKWLYRLFATAQAGEPDERARDRFPKKLFNTVEEWETFRKFGFGLIALKKMSAHRYEEGLTEFQGMSARSFNALEKKEGELSLAKIIKFWLSADREVDLNYYKKISPAPSRELLLQHLLVKGNFKLTTGNDSGKLIRTGGTLINANAITRIKLKQTKITFREFFWDFFDTIVSGALGDYIKFRSINEQKLRVYFDEQGGIPLFTLDSTYPYTSDRFEDDDEEFNGDESDSEDYGDEEFDDYESDSEDYDDEEFDDYESDSEDYDDEEFDDYESDN